MPKQTKRQTNPLLTILVPLYNKETTLKETLDSILMQETDIPYEILIADDASKDKSVEIVKEYQSKNPCIKLLETKENQGLAHQTYRMYALIKSKYFTVLDPDDYWISKTKIQDAITFLESHRDFTSYQEKTLLKSNTEEKIYVDYPNDCVCDYSHFCAGGGNYGTHFQLIFQKHDIKGRSL